MVITTATTNNSLYCFLEEKIIKSLLSLVLGAKMTIYLFPCTCKFTIKMRIRRSLVGPIP